MKPVEGLAVACMLVCGCGDAQMDDRPARWSYIFPAIVQASCATAGCHAKLSRAGGIELESIAGSYAILVGPSGSGNLVVPGEPDRSRLLQLLRAKEAPRMPPDGALPNRDVALIERWILEGAAP